MTDARRAAEHRELYASLGHEVALVAVEAAAFDPACAACVASGEQVAVFTRRPAPQPPEAPVAKAPGLQPTVSRPSAPQPTVSRPSAPQPTVSRPSAPQPTVSRPSAPQTKGT